jgi:hypothetical protein
MGFQKLSIRKATFKGVEKPNDWEKLLETLLGGKQPKMNCYIVVKTLHRHATMRWIKI